MAMVSRFFLYKTNDFTGLIKMFHLKNCHLKSISRSTKIIFICLQLSAEEAIICKRGQRHKPGWFAKKAASSDFKLWSCGLAKGGPASAKALLPNSLLDRALQLDSAFINAVLPWLRKEMFEQIHRGYVATHEDCFNK